MNQKNTGTVALVVGIVGGVPRLVESFSDAREIAILETTIEKGVEDPISCIQHYRLEKKREEEEFADYVEDLLSKSAVNPEVLEHGVQWFKSRVKIEEFRKQEVEAATVIAGYAFQIFMQNIQRTDFILAGPSAQVRVRVFVIDEASREERGAA